MLNFTANKFLRHGVMPLALIALSCLFITPAAQAALGDDCTETVECAPDGYCTDQVCCFYDSCNHGVCKAEYGGTCECENNWWGSMQCDVCSSNWTGDNCDSCAPGFYGDICQETDCGDGIEAVGWEQCDDGTNDYYSGCSPDCMTVDIIVTTFDDELNISDRDGDCSLREAVEAANTDAAVDACPAGSGHDLIYIPAGTYTLSLVPDPNYPYENTYGSLFITDNTHLHGDGQEVTIIDGHQIDRVIHTENHFRDPPINVHIQHLTITGGWALDGWDGFEGHESWWEGHPGNSGGGIFASGTELGLRYVTVRDNVAGDGGDGYTTVGLSGSGGDGGGIMSYFPVHLDYCIIKNNKAGNGGTGTYSTEDTSWREAYMGARGGRGGGVFGYNGVELYKTEITNNTAGNGGDCRSSSTSCRGGRGGDGGGVFSYGRGGIDQGGPDGYEESFPLQVDISTISGNKAGDGGYLFDAKNGIGTPGGHGGAGGGIWALGYLWVNKSAIISNQSGAGYDNDGVELKAGDGGMGGGIFSEGEMDIRLSTVADNITGKGGDGKGEDYGVGGDSGKGGGIYSIGLANIYAATIVDNTTGIAGAASFNGTAGTRAIDGGISHHDGEIHLSSSIVSMNSPSECQFTGTSDSPGYNLVGSKADCRATQNTDIETADPKLSPLGDYGGFTPSYLPQIDSPALAVGLCENIGGYSELNDQRVQPRPMPTGESCDIGSVERDGSTGGNCLDLSFCDTASYCTDQICCTVDNCGENGSCAAPDGTCDCEEGWSGDLCDACDEDYYGETCTACPACVNGPCDDGIDGEGECICDDGWTDTLCDDCDDDYFGADCEACPACVNGLCNEGLSGNGICACDDGWTGDLCDEAIVEPDGDVDGDAADGDGVVDGDEMPDGDDADGDEFLDGDEMADGDEVQCPIGSAGCPCDEDDSCDDNLICEDGICIVDGELPDGDTGATDGDGSEDDGGGCQSSGESATPWMLALLFFTLLSRQRMRVRI